MPELPEVETVRRGLLPLVEQRVIQRFTVFDPRLTQPIAPETIADAVEGLKCRTIDRRGKYLIWRFVDGVNLVQHLRMTGSWQQCEERDNEQVRPRYTRAVVSIVGSGGELCYCDPRRFGTLLLLDDADVEQHLASRLGPEPLSDEFGPRVLFDRLKRRNAPIKAVLLDQRTVAGLGNIYVDEALHLAGISPFASASSLGIRRVTRLTKCIVERLTEAIAAGGATLRDYRGVRGQSGSMQERFVVYGRGGEPCLNCGRPILRNRIAGRSTWWCSRCQRP